MRLGGLIREALSSIRSQPVASVVTALVVIAMTVTVMLTTGRTVGAEQRVLGSFDDVGTRAIKVTATSSAGLTAGVLNRLENIQGIEWAAGFSTAVDATNSYIADGVPVPVRLSYGRDFDALGIPRQPALPGHAAFASQKALGLLGLPDGAGSITTSVGDTYAVVGGFDAPEFLRGFEPIVFVPQAEVTGTEAMSVLIVIAERPDLVAPVSDAVVSVLAVADPTKVTIETSEALAELRAIVEGQLGSFSRGLVLATLALTGLVVAVILYGLVMMRRKDFGRRRALGAAKRLIVSLLVTQTIVLSAAGFAIGVLASLGALAATRDPVPGPEFIGALAVLTVATAVIAALVPAILASRREPIRELRVP